MSIGVRVHGLAHHAMAPCPSGAFWGRLQKAFRSILTRSASTQLTIDNVISDLSEYTIYEGQTIASILRQSQHNYT